MKKKKCRIQLLLLVLLLTGCTQIENTAQYIQETEEVIQTVPVLEENTVEKVTALIVEDDIVQDEEPQQIRLVMVGDVLLHTRVNESGAMPDGSYNYDHLFAKVKGEIQSADLALVNQEVILGGRELGLSGYPAFNGAYEVGDSLVEAGFDVVLHATNHALDKGKKGLLNCIGVWKQKYPEIGVTGIYESQEDADDIYVTEVKGIRIAILNYTYGTNGISLPQDMPYAVKLWEEESIKRDVEQAKQRADFIVVCPHWGTEYVLTQTMDQESKAQFLADLGVDLVIGTHPHVIEPVEWVTGKEGNETLVYYSIGNFINATSGTGSGAAARMLGAMADVTIAVENEEVYISEYTARPLVTHLVEGSGQITTYFLEDYTEEMAEQNQMKLQDANFSLGYCKQLWNDVFEIQID